jgi:small-conductance mechanosensitive channel/CRP-like cAMP-binding protein
MPQANPIPRRQLLWASRRRPRTCQDAFVSATAGLPSLFLALGLLALVFALRQSEAARRLVQGSRELVLELRAPQRVLALYVVVRLLLELSRGRAWSPGLLHTLGFLALFSAGVGVVRTGDVALYLFLRARGRPVAPRIIRTLLVWALTLVIAAAASNREFGFDLSAMLTTSALLSVVLGFALQESLGNLFAGLTLNAEKPFEHGDWVSFGKWTGRVHEVGWRSTRLITLDDDELLVPNGLLSREVVVNHSRPSARDCVELELRLDAEAPPGKAKEVVLAAVRSCKGVLSEPAPLVELVRFADDGLDYRVRFFTGDYAHERELIDAVQQALWYALRRAAIDIPYPQTTLSRRERPAQAEERRRKEHLAEAQELLARIDFVAALKPQQREELARAARFLEYGPGEPVVRQGEAGETCFLVARGELAVRVLFDSGEREVARLSHGAFFGEMSVLTGEPRSATVVAASDAALLGIDREAFKRVLAGDEQVMEELARIIAGRRAELAIAKEQEAAAGPQPEDAAHGSLLARIKGIFGFVKGQGGRR